jgi:LPXTG-motif cell wall-anchored protein
MARLRNLVNLTAGALALVGTAAVVVTSPVEAASQWSSATFIAAAPSNFDPDNGWQDQNWDEVRSMSCGARGECTIGSIYSYNWVGWGGGYFGAVVSQSNGSWSPNQTPANWRRTTPALGVGLRNIGPRAIDCPSGTFCAFGGMEGYSPFVATKSNDQWSNPQLVRGFTCSESFEWPRGCTWGTTFSAPQGTPSLEANPNDIPGGAILDAIDCTTSNYCVIGGSYLLLNTNFDVAFTGSFVSVLSNGVWSTPIEIPGLRAMSDGVNSPSVRSISCASPGNCAVVGFYPSSTNSEGNRAFVATMTNGVWSNAMPVPGIGVNGPSSANAVACPSAGNCTVTGVYRVDNSTTAAFVSTLSNGVWSNAVPLVGTTTSVGSDWNFPNGLITNLACASAGNCTVAGNYNNSTVEKAFIATQTNGTWASALAVPGLSSLGNNTDSRVSSLACPAAGDCVAVGTYKSALNLGGRTEQPFIVVKTDGTWGNAMVVPGIDLATSVMDPGSIRVSCASAGECSVAGSVVRNSASKIFVLSYSDPNPPAPTTTAPATTTAPSTSLAPSTTLPTAPIAGPLAPGLGKARIGTVIVDVVKTTSANGDTVLSVGNQSYRVPSRPLDTSKKVILSGSGAQPGSTVAIQLFSTPRILGYATVAGDGTFSAEVSIPADVPSGNHNLQMVSTATDGTEVVVQIGVSVTNTLQLPATGSNHESPLVALSLLMLGVAVLIVRRRLVVVD